MKRAFTLIELLVVIAIIAILAAILFPVFAQAKVAAKATASLSNVKQLNTASIMYSGDFDDTCVVDGAWNPGPGWMVSYGAGADLSPWTWLVLPYIKSVDLFVDPMTSAHPTAPNLGATITKLYYSLYGYNYSNLSPWDGENRHPVSFSGVNKPSETVMFTSKFNYIYEGSFGWYGPGSFLPVLYNVEPPSCDVAPGYCFFNWGLSGDTVNGMKSMRTEGAYTGGVAIRKNGQAIVSWTDSHASIKAPGYLASGTNWSTTINANDLRVTDKSKYLWATDY